MAKNNDTSITIRIPKEIKQWLIEEAEKRDLSISYLVRRALEEYQKKGR